MKVDKLAEIRRPIEAELNEYARLFAESLTHEDDYLGQALSHMRRRNGKMMRPILVLLAAKAFAPISEKTLRSAVTLELLHTASLIHDDVVDDSGERRGQASVNALFGNKVAVLVGDYLLSKSLHQAYLTDDLRIVEIVARLGGTLAEGEVKQLANIRQAVATEEAYFDVIRHKTAALFAACARLGAISADCAPATVEQAATFGEIIGLCFQIRDDIFDYYDDETIGKPTGNDLMEGKLTLPAIYALNHTDRTDVQTWVAHVKNSTATPEEIKSLVDFTKSSGGIDYAHQRMEELRKEAAQVLNAFPDEAVRRSLAAYLEYTIDRKL
ncbi:MAG: polyprenyl synthetase family protein [Alloprevotella tannerae]|uniref:polyprenyl synthetase family protein n=1 Tax=Alloprevotella tannerae TaxID=76122 RepID=UPI0028E5A65A|nr:polyprenyl synthetase family protein [Alloprevotella tannerae]